MKGAIAAMFVVVLAALVPGAAEACTCVESVPPCQEYWRADAVFVGRVTAIETSSVVPRTFGQGRRVSFDVSRGLKDVAGSTAVVETGLGSGDCGYRFTRGKDYVVYATRRDDGALTTSICTRTAALERAGGDVAYANAVAEGTASEGGVTGTIRFMPMRLGEGSSGRPRPMPGVTVVVAGAGGEHRVTSDNDGRFGASGLTPGRYAIRLDPTEGYYARSSSRTIELPDPRACAKVDGLVAFDGHVTGRVVNADGNAVAGLTLELVGPSQLERRIGGAHRILSGRDGRFEFSEIPPGQFIVAVNPDRTSRPASQPSAYYPGVTDPSRASVRTLAGGQRVDVGDFSLPRDASFVPVQGVVTAPDGLPVAGAKVYLKLAGEQGFIWSEPAITDGSGAFVLAAVTAETYELVVDRVTEEGGRRRVLNASSEPFTAVPGLAPVTLRLQPPR